MSPSSSASASSTAAVVAVIDEPSGSLICRNSSGRSEIGKNCCCTLPKPTIAATKIAAVAATTLRRCRRQASIAARSSR